MSSSQQPTVVIVINGSIDSVVESTLSVLLTPTLFFFELLDMGIKFVEVLSLRMKLLLELAKACHGVVSQMNGRLRGV
jgi:hypothetical protein